MLIVRSQHNATQQRAAKSAAMEEIKAMAKKSSRNFKHARPETEPMFSQRLNRNARRWVVEVNSEVVQGCGESQFGEDSTPQNFDMQLKEEG
jgi:hypothetical protein